MTCGCARHARLLEQVRGDRAADDRTARPEVDLDPLAEARRVVVAKRARVAERFEHRVALDDHALQRVGE